MTMPDLWIVWKIQPEEIDAFEQCFSVEGYALINVREMIPMWMVEPGKLNAGAEYLSEGDESVQVGTDGSVLRT